MRGKDIIVLGSTGSIGTQALDVISASGGKYRVKALVAGNNYNLLAKQAMLHKPEVVIIGNKEHYTVLKDALKGFSGKLLSGADEIESYVSDSKECMAIAAMVGFAGLRPVMAALKAGIDVALANKETLVVAGELVTKLARETGAKLIPVDSEHSAIYQCLVGENPSEIERVTLTASGGPFRGYTKRMIEDVTPEMALKHPNWDMGSKVTIDSASLMNKGLEVIEAHWLFNVEPEMIDVVIHPQSIIHSFVTFRDGSVKAQLGLPDMRLPISYALSYPERDNTVFPRTDFTALAALTFEKPDTETFRNLEIAFEALRAGGNQPCIMNAANEIVVEAFLRNDLKFNMMPIVIDEVIKKINFVPHPSLEQLEMTDMEARVMAREEILKSAK